MKWAVLWLSGLAVLAGCQMLPEAARRPSVQNPFPQLSKVAVAEFFNATTDDTVVRGLDVATAYASELQAVPGFEVVPPDVVKHQMFRWKMTPADLEDPQKRRALAEELEVDAIVVGTITEFSPYYPPRMSLKTQWYATNPGYHPIPPGYGLPWGTPQQEEIPERLVYEAEMALAKAQLKTQTPQPTLDDSYHRERRELREQDAVPAGHEAERGQGSGVGGQGAKTADRTSVAAVPASGKAALQAASSAEYAAAAEAGFPADWPDPRGFIPPGPQSARPAYRPTDEPILAHVRSYNGHDVQFTTALRNYYFFRDEARFGGWQSYLQRSDDFVRFCCHLHVAEMLSARGGAGKSRLVWRWPEDR